MNYGHQLGTYTESVIDADLAILKNAGYKYIRVAMATYSDAATITKIRNVALRVLAAGMLPMYGVTSGAGVNATTWQLFLTALNTEATWARDNGIPFFLMGNEESLHIDGTTQTWANAVTDLQNKAAYIKDTIGYRGSIVYSAVNDATNVATWTGDSVRKRIDLIGWNLYYDLIYTSQGVISWQNKLATRLAANPGHTIVTEWANINAFQGATVNQQEYLWYEQLQAMWAVLQNSGIPIGCFFAFTDGSFALQTDYWALKLSSGTMRLAWDAVRN